MRAARRKSIYGFYTPGASDYADLLERLRQARIDVLYVGGYGPDAGLILRTARERGDDLQLVGGDGLGMDGFWTIAGESGEGTIFSGRPDVRNRPDAAALAGAVSQPRPGHPHRRPRRLRRGPGVGPGGRARRHLRARRGDGELRRGRFDTVLGRVAFDSKGDLEGAAWQWKVWMDGDYVPLNGLRHPVGGRDPRARPQRHSARTLT